MITTAIAINTSFIGIHCWPSAPERRSYLRSPHRHKFGVRVEVSVEEHDREIEFHDLKDEVNLALPPESVRLTDQGNGFLNMSCEHHAKRIADIIAESYPNRTIRVTVDEDGECESIVTLTP